MIQWEKYSFAYGKKPVLENVSLSLSPGTYFVMGENGSGKSTFLQLLGGWLKSPTPVVGLKNAAYLPAQFQLHPQLRIQDVAEIYGITWKDFVNSHIFTSLKVRELAPFSFVGELSSGEKQRLLLATVLSQKTDTLILDEPFNHLDWISQLRVLQILKQNSYAYLFVSTHDFQIPLHFLDAKILLLEGHRIHDLGPCRQALISEKFQKSFHFHSQIIDNPIDRSLILAIAESK